MRGERWEELAAGLERARQFAGTENTIGAPRLDVPVDRAMHAQARQAGIAVAPFWPEGRPYVLCVTHDMDRVWSTVQRASKQRRRPLSAIKSLTTDLATAFNPSRWNDNPFFNFDRILTLQRELNFRSALYVLFERKRWAKALSLSEWQHVIGVYDPQAIQKEIGRFARAGNEVGVHGSFDSFCRDELLTREKRSLESWGADTVTGIRNHYLQYDEVLSAKAQRIAGFRYDSTLGFNFTNGFRGGTCFPFLRQGVWELPFQLMDSALRYQFSSARERVECASQIQEVVRQMGGVLVVNWHTHVMNGDVFPDEVNLLSRIIHNAKSQGAWIARPGEVIEWWQQRSRNAACEKTVASVI